jgi:hypothetical protein
MEATCSGDHVLLSNHYAAVGRCNGVEDVWNTMRSKGIEKILVAAPLRWMIPYSHPRIHIW